MNKSDNISDRQLQELIKNLEKRESPPGLKDNIMNEVRVYSARQRMIPVYLQIAAITLFTALILIPFSVDPMINFLKYQIIPLFDPLSQISMDFFYIVIIIFTASVLLLADRLFSLYLSIRKH
jgi:hypothetical protein